MSLTVNHLHELIADRKYVTLIFSNALVLNVPCQKLKASYWVGQFYCSIVKLEAKVKNEKVTELWVAFSGLHQQVEDDWLPLALHLKGTLGERFEFLKELLCNLKYASYKKR